MIQYIQTPEQRDVCRSMQKVTRASDLCRNWRVSLVATHSKHNLLVSVTACDHTLMHGL